MNHFSFLSARMKTLDIVNSMTLLLTYCTVPVGRRNTGQVKVTLQVMVAIILGVLVAVGLVVLIAVILVVTVAASFSELELPRNARECAV